MKIAEKKILFHLICSSPGIKTYHLASEMKLFMRQVETMCYELLDAGLVIENEGWFCAVNKCQCGRSPKLDMTLNTTVNIKRGELDVPHADFSSAIYCECGESVTRQDFIKLPVWIDDFHPEITKRLIEDWNARTFINGIN